MLPIDRFIATHIRLPAVNRRLRGATHVPPAIGVVDVGLSGLVTTASHACPCAHLSTLGVTCVCPDCGATGEWDGSSANHRPECHSSVEVGKRRIQNASRGLTQMVPDLFVELFNTGWTFANQSRSREDVSWPQDCEVRLFAGRVSARRSEQPAQLEAKGNRVEEPKCNVFSLGCSSE